MAGDKEVTDHKSKLWRIKDGDILKRVEDIYIYIYRNIYKYIYKIMKRKGLVFSENTGSGFVFGAEK